MNGERKRVNVMPEQALLEGFISTPPAAIFLTESGVFERTRALDEVVVRPPIEQMPDKELLEAFLNGEAHFNREIGKFELKKL